MQIPAISIIQSELNYLTNEMLVCYSQENILVKDLRMLGYTPGEFKMGPILIGVGINPLWRS